MGKLEIFECHNQDVFIQDIKSFLNKSTIYHQIIDQAPPQKDANFVVDD